MQHSNRYIFLFAFILTLVSSLLLGLISVSLKELRIKNASVYKQSKVLQGLGLYSDNLKDDDILNFFSSQGYNDKYVVKKVVDFQGQEITNIALEKVNKIFLSDEMKKAKKEERNYPIFVVYLNKQNKLDDRPDAYCIPIYGYGLWSICYGYISLEKDAKTVKGIVYYSHKETPGLGGEIDNPEWQKQFQGKSIIYDGKLIPIQTVKVPKAPHEVQAVSAATFTMNGVNEMLDKFLRIYDPYLQKKRSNN